MAIGLGYICNISFLVIFKKFIWNDSDFKQWKYNHSVSPIIVNFIGTISSFKFSRIIYSKLFGINALSMPLNELDALRPINILTGMLI